MSLTPSVVDWLGPIWFFYFFIFYHSSFLTQFLSLITHHSSLKNTPISYNSAWWVVWVEYLSGFFNSNTHLYVTHWVPQKSIANQVYRTVTKPTRVLSLSLSFSRPFHNKTLFFPNFKNPYTTAASPLFYHRSSALQTLTPPLIFRPSFPRLHCVRSLRYQEG